MQITVLANKDLASCVALNYLLPLLHDHRLNVFLSSAVGTSRNAASLHPRLQDLKFMEQQLFNELVFPMIDASPSLSSAARLKTFNGLSKYSENPVSELNCINDDEFARFASTGPDLVLSIRYGTILKEKVISLPELGILNLHSGKLPDYRGVMATFWALLNDEQSLDTTLHYIDDPGIDSGPIVSTTSLDVVPGNSYLWHVLELYKEGCQLLAEAVAKLSAERELPAITQSGEGNYYSFPSAQHIEEFQGKGKTFYEIDDILNITRKFTAS